MCMHALAMVRASCPVSRSRERDKHAGGQSNLVVDGFDHLDKERKIIVLDYHKI